MKRLGAIGAALLGVVLFAGCTSGGGSPKAADTTTPAPTVTTTATATPTATATVTATPRPTPTGSSAPVAAGNRCTTAHLTGAIGERNGAPAGSGDGMNQQQVAIILTNTGSTACTLQGWPGVSLVGDGNGTQLGAAATFDRTTPHPTVTIAPGAKVQAPIDYSDAAVYAPSECNQKTADGVRVYPPGSTSSLFIAQKWDACTSTQHSLMKVGAFVTYP
ncbi:DUF4232 domain-containing protein [Gryllotalpicola reticulitermitis]|uniref:DUF4232 domain-containing protein n=1 Tax=Gryllotalpicola reticulitermitis TaxID=1184153 RepID=A0ABV8Q8A2_9MICO